MPRRGRAMVARDMKEERDSGRVRGRTRRMEEHGDDNGSGAFPSYAMVSPAVEMESAGTG